MEEMTAAELRRQIAGLIDKTPPAAKIASIQQVEHFKGLIARAKKLTKSGNIESLRSCAAELKSLHGV